MTTALIEYKREHKWLNRGIRTILIDDEVAKMIEDALKAQGIDVEWYEIES
jgi:hypothetical protein